MQTPPYLELLGTTRQTELLAEAEHLSAVNSQLSLADRRRSEPPGHATTPIQPEEMLLSLGSTLPAARPPQPTTGLSRRPRHPAFPR